MQLNFKQYSDVGKPLVSLHGLFGSLANWGWHSKELSKSYAVYGVDLRNHGASPHSSEMNYESMAADVLEFLDRMELSSCYLIGHSMGGKVAMQLALKNAARVDKLLVVDIAPVEYPSDSSTGHEQVFAGLSSIDLASLSSRKSADEQLQAFVEEPQVRQFLLTNLSKQASGEYAWKLNLAALENQYAHLRAKPAAAESTAAFDKPVLFVKGALSNYIQESHQQRILSLFPNAKVKIIMQAGHWLHAEKPQAFNKIALDFFKKA